jgi:hypothetical protein
MAVSPALQRGERGQQEPVSPGGAAQNTECAIKITFMRLPSRIIPGIATATLLPVDWS